MASTDIGTVFLDRQLPCRAVHPERADGVQFIAG
jgi:hypothetical protein